MAISRLYWDHTRLADDLLRSYWSHDGSTEVLLMSRLFSQLRWGSTGITVTPTGLF